MAFVSIDKIQATPLSQRIVEVFADLHVYMAGLQSSMADKRLYRQTVSELSGLSNYELTDLGLCRSSIRDVAYQAVYNK